MMVKTAFSIGQYEKSVLALSDVFALEFGLGTCFRE